MYATAASCTHQGTPELSTPRMEILLLVLEGRAMALAGSPSGMKLESTRRMLLMPVSLCKDTEPTRLTLVSQVMGSSRPPLYRP